ncbi:MAG TPA: aminotransferase class I/II-fold pyridoxal phosphate-dependent enzyme [Alphaproteobacteria bacterium]|nr:aminotransferase class I/II-fold pyridoxal phosphate-dependent enzyme [Alphaproteobacteria bacterium]
MFNSRLDSMRDSPFRRLATLLSAATPRSNIRPIDLSVGEPQHQPPAFIRPIIDGRADTWNRYPSLSGSPELRKACVDWLLRRYRLPSAMIDPETMIMPCSGTREGLYMAATLAITAATAGTPTPLAFLPNPFYQVYAGAATLAGAELAFMPATRETGFLPDLDVLDPKALDRAQLMYICSPSNPQGAIANLEYLKRAITLARRHDFLLVMDECYAEIYNTDTPPPGALEAAAALGGSLQNLLVFHTLSKRSSAPGLRSGFCVGSTQAIALLFRLRSYSCAATPVAVMDAATALWQDDSHVIDTRAYYRAKYDIAERILKGRFGFYRPAGGFYLWLDVGNGETATKRLWTEAGIKALPGAYLTRPSPDGTNASERYIRLALVSDIGETEDALTRVARTL